MLCIYFNKNPMYHMYVKSVEEMLNKFILKFCEIHMDDKRCSLEIADNSLFFVRNNIIVV